MCIIHNSELQNLKKKKQQNYSTSITHAVKLGTRKNYAWAEMSRLPSCNRKFA